MSSFVRRAGLLCTGLIAGVIATTSLTVFAEKDSVTSLPLEDIELFADVFGSIKKYYVDDVSDSKLIENAVKGMVEGLDPHSNFLDNKAFEDMQESTVGEFGGLGIEVTKDPSGVRVISPIDDTPAERAGVMAGDIIVKIDGKATANLSLNDNVKLMRGKPKTSIELTIARKGVDKPIVLKLVRAIIKVQSVKSKLLADNIGYIRISQFQERTADDLAKALSTLSAKQPLKGLVLDLRNNPGGLLNAAIGVSAAFLPKDSIVVSTRGRDNAVDRQFIAAKRDWMVNKNTPDIISSLPAFTKTLPMVVLINPASASASEIVSGALQDHHRATIMGSRSFGKGSVQTILPLRLSKDKTIGIKITTARYYTPSGRSIQAKGIDPDIAVDDTPEGNYPSFNVREADLAHHIVVTDGKKSAAPKNTAPEKNNDDEEQLDDNRPAPTLRYLFGDEKDFVLQQATAYLTAKPVITHAMTQLKIKEQRAKELDADKDKAGK